MGCRNKHKGKNGACWVLPNHKKYLLGECQGWVPAWPLAELSRARGRCDRLSEALAQSEREVAACRDALHDYQLQMEAQRATHEALRSHVHDLQVTMCIT